MAHDKPWHASGTTWLLLGDCCQVTAGPSGSLLDNLNDGPGGVPVIAPPDLTEHFTVDIRRIRRVSDARAQRLARYALQAGDILLVRQGTLGRLALVRAEHTGWFYSSSCLRIRPDRRRVLPEYLAAYLTHPPVQRKLVAQAQSGTVPSLNSAILNEFSVEVPPLARQQNVIDALADIDEQIEVQRTMLDRLIALRPSVFDQLTREE
ncbi:restriction endonuclease subunit S [Streptomyces sp. NPDC004546]|uniref:restriction endonuclease subunit S n=1 Tax=Streptomyces sp. NPDC004546 TaxID=3154282 RepID=UPI0033A10E81